MAPRSRQADDCAGKLPTLPQIAAFIFVNDTIETDSGKAGAFAACCIDGVRRSLSAHMVRRRRPVRRDNPVHDIGTDPLPHGAGHTGRRRAQRRTGLGRQRIELRAQVLKPCQSRHLGTSQYGALPAGRDLGGFPPHRLGRPMRHRVPCDSPGPGREHATGGCVPVRGTESGTGWQHLLRPDDGR
jgi:hypothetical protein